MRGLPDQTQQITFEFNVRVQGVSSKPGEMVTYSTSIGWAAYQNVAYQTDSPSAASKFFVQRRW